MHVLESRIEDPAIEHVPSNNALILDGMALIQMMKHIPVPLGSWLRSYSVEFYRWHQIQSQQELISCVTHIPTLVLRTWKGVVVLMEDQQSLGF